MKGAADFGLRTSGNRERTKTDNMESATSSTVGPVLPIELFSVYSNNFWSKGEISTCSHVMAEISSLPSGVNEKYICRLSFVPITRSTRPRREAPLLKQRTERHTLVQRDSILFIKTLLELINCALNVADLT